MIWQLIRINIKSNLGYCIFFLICNAFFIFIISTLVDEVPGRPFTDEIYIVMVVWLMLICFLCGGFALMRYNRERRNRLYMQLPVTSTEVRLAYWAMVAIFVGISTLVLIVLLLLAGLTGVHTFVVYVLLYFFHAGSVIALLTLLLNYVGSLFGSRTHNRGLAYYYALFFLVIFGFILLGFVVHGYVYLAHGLMDSWGSLTVSMTLFCLLLVALDIYLYRKADNYLG